MIHFYDTNVADIFGVQAAAIFQNIYHWCARNEANGSNFHDGRYWTYNSVSAFKKIFSYMSENQIRYALDKLVEGGLLVTGNYNEMKYDRTLWYAVTDYGKCICENSKMKLEKIRNESEKIHEPIPNINTNRNTNRKTDILRTERKIRKKTVKHTYGEYQNVLLSDEQLEKLKAEFPDWKDRIENCSEYVAKTGKSYKDFLAVIRSWAKNDKPKQKQESKKQYADYGERIMPDDYDDSDKTWRDFLK